MIHIFQPDTIAVEDPFVGKGERAFIKSALAIGQAQAVVLIGAASQGIPVHRYAPATVETRRNRLRRRHQGAVQRMTASTLGLTTMPESDAADALAVGLCHLFETSPGDLALREIRPGEER